MTTKASQVRVTGPLAAHAEGFRVNLIDQGYTPLSAANQLRVMAHLSRWLANQRLGARDLTTERIDAFLAVRRAEGYTCWLSQRGLAPLLAFLRSQEAAPTPVPVVVTTPMKELLVYYHEYLVDERGLASGTVRNHTDAARLFLTDRCRAHEGELCLGELTAADVAGFVMAECPSRSVGSAKILVTGLRSLLRFLHLSGRVPEPLTAVVPAVAGWRGGSLPRALPVDQVKRLLGGCDRRRAVGRRDLAILLLLVRLGLRACEVAALELDDIDWQAGELVVRVSIRRAWGRRPRPRMSAHLDRHRALLRLRPHRSRRCDRRDRSRRQGRLVAIQTGHGGPRVG